MLDSVLQSIKQIFKIKNLPNRNKIRQTYENVRDVNRLYLKIHRLSYRISMDILLLDGVFNGYTWIVDMHLK